ncbi:uncharacterized protein EV420DRAFT_1209404 [Desarmillaria tabescens]|uniref:Uncharacterized protein n=1 Tax=Armillaria tabescens TaxID=1929756 RepID=A0AA39JDB4_ARMTA|nr:uncharacterized protein EV420DRAFT_1209404 [Desarmillaria tabescens]KAK0438508.1 hypothetical protein EV420DRAFT_1209404 [Desarmillaria tabescens]
MVPTRSIIKKRRREKDGIMYLSVDESVIPTYSCWEEREARCWLSIELKNLNTAYPARSFPHSPANLHRLHLDEPAKPTLSSFKLGDAVQGPMTQTSRTFLTHTAILYHQLRREIEQDVSIDPGHVALEFHSKDTRILSCLKQSLTIAYSFRSNRKENWVDWPSPLI